MHSKKNLWYWYSWHQGDSCAKDPGIQLITDLVNTRSHLKTLKKAIIMFKLADRHDSNLYNACVLFIPVQIKPSPEYPV